MPHLPRLSKVGIAKGLQYANIATPFAPLPVVTAPQALQAGCICGILTSSRIQDIHTVHPVKNTLTRIIPSSWFTMDYFLIITGSILMLAGIVGCVLPMLPGPPLSFAGLLLLHITGRHQFSGGFLLTWSLVTLAITLLDYWIPVWGAKKFGAGRPGILGSVIGLLVGLIFFPPFGIVIGPFAGAVLGELFSGKTSGRALKAGFGSFAGVFSSTILKLTASGMMTWFFIRALVN